MSTQKWSDDELDDLFRNASKETDPTYDSAAWQDMETRLNNRDRTILGAKLLRWGVPLLLLLSTGGIIWYSQPSAATQPVAATTSRMGREPASVVMPTRPNRPPVEAGTPGSQARKRAETPDAAGEAPEQPTIADHPVTTNSVEPHPPLPPIRAKGNNPPIADSKRSHASETAGQPLSDRTFSPNNPVEPVHVTGSENRITTILEKRKGDAATLLVTKEPARAKLLVTRKKAKQVTGHWPGHVNDIARQDATPGGLGRQRSVGSGLFTSPKPANEPQSSGTTGVDYYVPASLRAIPNQDDQPATDRFVWPSLQPLTARGIIWPAPPELTAEPVSAETPASALPRTARTRVYGLSVQLVLSPDLSTVGLKKFDRPGSTLGLSVQYQLSERFSIQTGALWSTKVYTAQPTAYTSPMYMHVLPESITGRCTMFDVPVNLRYDVLLRPGGEKRGPKLWFVSSGVTSYFIDHEAYTFNFKNPNDPGITAKGWDNRVAGRKGGSFGLSNLNVSIGYEQSISRRLSWQVEPFMKIPLKPIGYYKVKLISTGAFLSLRYRL